MNASHILLVVASVVMCFPAPAKSQEAGLDQREKDFRNYLLWQKRTEFVPLIKNNDKMHSTKPAAQIGTTLADKAILNGMNFQEQKIKNEVEKLVTKSPDAADRTPTEAEELFAITKAYGEFVDVVTAIRLVKVKRMEKAQEQQRMFASKPPPPPPSVPSLSLREILRLTPVDRGTRWLKESSYALDLAKWRGEVVSRANASLSERGIGQNIEDLKKAVSEILMAAKQTLDAEYARLMPPLVADEYVLKYWADGLIKNAKRVNVSVGGAPSIAECKDPQRIRTVVYDVTDYFGVDCRTTVVVYQNASPPSDWRVGSENKSKGGFYELQVVKLDN